MRHLSQWTFWGRHEAFILSLILTLTFTLIPKIRALITTPIRWQLFSSVGGIPLWPHVDRLWCWSSTIICLHWWLWAILGHIAWMWLRDRPFNLKVGGGGGLWFFVSFRIFFPDNTRVRIFYFWRAKREFFFQNSTLGYMTKTLNHIIFFSSTKTRIFFSATLGIRIFFWKKNHNPPFKLNGRSLINGFFPILN